MRAGRKANLETGQTSFIKERETKALAVPAIRAALAEWREAGYPDVSETTRTLLNFWFHTDHKMAEGQPFRYYCAQQEALESLIYVYEVARTRRLYDLYMRFVPAEKRVGLPMPAWDDFTRYCVKMATGSGKTKVMALAIAWQYFNAVREANADYAKTFLLIAPNIIVFERLRGDFAGGSIFQNDPIIPKEFQNEWDMRFYMRGDAEQASSKGALYLTNIQQLYERDSRKKDDEPAIMTTMLGATPPANLSDDVDFRQRIIERADSPLLVLNDEAHHTHDPKSAWNETIRALHQGHAAGLAGQLDFTATPRHQKGALFPWIISDYPLEEAIRDGIVKRPWKGSTDIGEFPSNEASRRYEAYLVSGVERWREYREQLAPMGKRPLLFIMMNATREADDVGAYLQRKYPADFAGEKTLIIHTKSNGDIMQRDLDAARKAAKEVDEGSSSINAIVSVLMLREGWDVQNVTVIVGLRPYSSDANVLPEQTIGRGLRLMFRGLPTSYEERVDVIGNPAFLNFVEALEEAEGIQFESFDLDKDKLQITIIQPLEDKADYDIELPRLSPIIESASHLQEEIEELDVRDLRLDEPLPILPGTGSSRTFRYQGRDFLTSVQELERVYSIKPPQNSQEIIAYYADRIAKAAHLPSQFATLALKVRDFLKYHAFGCEVDLDSSDILHSIRQRAHFEATMNTFLAALREKLNVAQAPKLVGEGRKLSNTTPFPWSHQAPSCQKTVFNKVACDNSYEVSFASFLDQAHDVARFGKLPIQFGFSIPYSDSRGNLRRYYPDFVVVDENEVSYLVETKGREDIEVANKDRSAITWAEQATALTGQEWRYVKVLQKDFQDLAPATFGDCAHLGTLQLDLFN